eukprot:TRINITY_DN1198_c0_g1_i1.p1 TRINITY_DN1198_c0_g1~~TRINITY_DN1198_c0_g1_i1.p1  ORF type:complete len:175 (-),score=24.74 TRINITY_DN1198_c0_g1_i1:876-1400(-)
MSHLEEMVEERRSRKPLKVFTITFPLDLQKSRILLGLKKRGFGVNKWNGFGGKVKVGQETIEEAAKREVHEECSLVVKSMEKRGVIYFEFDEKLEPALFEVHIFVCSSWEGLEEESEEMRPKWYSLDAIPYDQMWIDDVFWLPLLLKGRCFEALFSFGDFETLVSHSIVDFDHY